MCELLTLDELRKLPTEMRGPCVYFLWRDDELLYIGATTQPHERVMIHWQQQRYASAQTGKPIPFNRETYLKSDRNEMWELENAYQAKYETPFNVYGRRCRSY